jgi:predicted phosphodiesterase
MLGLLSDAHGNLAAFERGVALLRAKGAERIYFLGDAVGYIPTIAVLERLQAEDIPCLQGNHEAMMLSRRYAQEREAAYRLGEIAALLPRDLLRWVSEWPTSRVVPVASGLALLVHGSPKDPTFDYVYPDSDLTQFIPGDARIRAVFMGNTHRPFIRDCGNVRFVNIGSCGLPRDDGGWGSVCLYDPDDNSARILRFPLADTAQELRRRYPDLHPAVLDAFARRSEGTPYGELCH